MFNVKKALLNIILDYNYMFKSIIMQGVISYLTITSYDIIIYEDQKCTSFPLFNISVISGLYIVVVLWHPTPTPLVCISSLNVFFIICRLTVVYDSPSSQFIIWKQGKMSYFGSNSAFCILCMITYQYYWFCMINNVQSSNY